MEAYRCDGCNKVSPDEHGMHIANGWAHINIKSRQISSFKNGEGFHICEECLPLNKPYKEEQVKSVISFLQWWKP